MAEPTLADAYSNEQEQDFQASILKRSPEQEQARIERMRMVRGQGSTRPVPQGAANDNTAEPANDNQLPEKDELLQDQERVKRARFIGAQGVLAPEEETQNQIEEEIKLSPSLIRYLPAFSVATFKDLSDYVGLGSLPVLGTLVTFICTVLMFIFLVFAKKNGSIQDMRFVIRRLLIVLVSFVIEGFVFGVNFFPFEIVTVALIYQMDKHLSVKQIAGLNNILQHLGKKRL